MEEAAAVRRTALDAVDDIEPPGLGERIRQRLVDGSMAPGVLAVLCARATDDALSVEAVAERAAGVQLIYEGLRLTRSLVHGEPWTSDDADRDADDRTDADMAILVADILVARGFYLLARTKAADAAVGTVRAFGRDQTVRRTGGDASLDRNLEADVFELAAVAGVTAAGRTPTASLREYADDLVPADGSMPPADAAFPEALAETVRRLTGSDSPADDGVYTSATTENRNA
jgi:hypothetical protein